MAKTEIEAKIFMYVSARGTSSISYFSGYVDM